MTNKPKSTRAQLEELRETIIRLEEEQDNLGNGMGEITWEDLASKEDKALKALGALETKRLAIPVALADARIREQELLAQRLDERIKVLEERRAATWEDLVDKEAVLEIAKTEHAEVQGEWADLGQKISDLQSERGAVNRERERLQAEVSGAAQRARAPVVRLGPSFMRG
jgi:chromosome segregation ATPase